MVPAVPRRGGSCIAGRPVLMGSVPILTTKHTSEGDLPRGAAHLPSSDQHIPSPKPLCFLKEASGRLMNNEQESFPAR